MSESHHTPRAARTPGCVPVAPAATRRHRTPTWTRVPGALPARPLNTPWPTLTSLAPSRHHLPRVLVGTRVVFGWARALPGALPLHLSPGRLCPVAAPPPLRAQAPLGARLMQGDRWGVWLPTDTPGTALSAPGPAGHCCLQSVSNNFVVCKAQGCLQNNLQSNLQFATPSTGLKGT